MTIPEWKKYYFELSIFLNENIETLSFKKISRIRTELGTVAHTIICSM